jgi:hypothetical protein
MFHVKHFGTIGAKAAPVGFKSLILLHHTRASAAAKRRQAQVRRPPDQDYLDLPPKIPRKMARPICVPAERAAD